MCMTWCIVLFRNRLTEMLVVVQKEDFPPQQEPLSKYYLLSRHGTLLSHSLHIHSESYSPVIILYNLEL